MEAPMSNAAKKSRRDPTPQFSADFLAWYALALTHDAAVNADSDGPYDDLCDALRPLEERIYAQPIRGIEDARVVAEIGMIALFWTVNNATGGNDPFVLGDDADLTSEFRNRRSAAEVIQAAAKLFLGAPVANPQRSATAAHGYGAGGLTSHRIQRLGELYAQLDDPAARDDRNDAEPNAICQEVYAIHDAILAAPASVAVGLAEHATAALHWYRNGDPGMTGPGITDTMQG
jgi:hypothetical protein